MKDEITERGIKYQVYRTPKWVYEWLYNKYPNHFIGRVIDPSAGDARMLLSIIKSGNKNRHCIIDIRKEEKFKWLNNKKLRNTKQKIKNFTKLKPPKIPIYNVAITNPPFIEATEFVDLLHKWVKPGGWIWILQRCDWLASKRRALWHSKHKSFAKVMILSKRPTWEIDNKEKNVSDIRDYAWFGYKIGSKNKGPRIGWLVGE